jgi:arabinofuranosyltransferase
MSDLAAVFRRYWPVLAAAVLLVPHALMFDFVSDDAYISFRYAKNLAELGQLVFNPGERVEGFTNFLWTVLLAGGIKLGLSPVLTSRFLGIAFAVGTMGVAVRLSLRLDRDQPSRWHLAAPLGLAATGAFACWSTGGLETQLFTFLSFMGFERVMLEVDEGRGFSSGIWFALAAMTRPEGLLFFAVAGLYRLLSKVARDWQLLPRRHEVAWLAAFLVLFVPYFAWRWNYYGWPFPNTFYVKASGGPETWRLGLYYLRRFAEDYGAFFFVPVMLLGWPARGDRRRRSLFLLTALVWGVFAVYTVSVGGDFMGLYRFILPVMPLGAVALQEGLRTLSIRLAPFAGRPALALAGLVIAAGFLAGSAKVSHTAATITDAENGIDTPAYLKKYALDRIPVGIWLGHHARPDDLMTVGGAGVIPYYSGIASYDVYGLVDAQIAHDPKMSISDRPGHEKWGSDAYMLSRHPTLITHKYCILGPCGQERWPYPGYEWVHVTIPGIDPVYYSFMKRLDRAFGPFPARR